MKMKKIFFMIGAAVLALSTTSCGNDDDFTESIFDTDIPVVDPTAATADFDQWIYDNFGKPYNVQIDYQFNMNASPLAYQLTPADYDKSQLLAHFIKYLFYDVYTKYAGENFMKQYGPRLFHFIGSSAYSANTGTEILGTASGGVKITLYNINEMKPYSENVDYTPADIVTLNERYFHTMHHEFSHILHQTKSYPVTFGQVTPSTYDPLDWQERDSVTTHQLGYITHYASSANYEDFVETLSGIITDTDVRWMNRIINACIPGVRAGDKERVLELVDSLGIDVDAANTPWNNFAIYSEEEYSRDTWDYVPTGRVLLDVHRMLPNTQTFENMVGDQNNYAVAQYRYTQVGKFTSFRDFLDKYVKILPDGDIAGMNAILKKIDIATKWYTDQWGLRVYTLRKEVRERQNNINDFIHNEVTIYPLK